MQETIYRVVWVIWVGGKNPVNISVILESLKLMDATFLRYVLIKPAEVDGKSLKSITLKCKVFYKKKPVLSFSDHVSILLSIPTSKYFRGNG